MGFGLYGPLRAFTRFIRGVKIRWRREVKLSLSPPDSLLAASGTLRFHPDGWHRTMGQSEVHLHQQLFNFFLFLIFPPFQMIQICSYFSIFSPPPETVDVPRSAVHLCPSSSLFLYPFFDIFFSLSSTILHVLYFVCSFFFFFFEFLDKTLSLDKAFLSWSKKNPLFSPNSPEFFILSQS